MNIVAELEQTTKELYKLNAYKEGLYKKIENNLKSYLIGKYKGTVIKRDNLQYVFFNLRVYAEFHHDNISPANLKATLYFTIISKITSVQKKELDEAIRDFESNNGIWLGGRRKIDLCLSIEYTFTIQEAMENNIDLQIK
jgi:hypothetical protein